MGEERVILLFPLQRNPDIKLYGLPWSFPAWLGNGTRDPYNDPNRLATYIFNWVRGAKQVHNLNIDYVGVSVWIPCVRG